MATTPPARPVERGLTISLTIDEWRDIRDALVHAHASGFALRDNIRQLAHAIGEKLHAATGNPMDRP